MPSPHAPLVVKDKVIVGTAGGEYGIRGFLAAFDAKTGKEAWRFYTIPGPGEPGHESWAGDSWKTGGGFGVGHRLLRSRVQPDLLGHRQSRPRLERRQARRRQPLHRFGRRARRRHGQAEVALPVLAARRVRLRRSRRCRCSPTSGGKGRPRKVMMWANRNGFFYVLDRVTGQFLSGKPFVKVNWTNGFDRKGPADAAAEAGADNGGHAHLSGQPGRDQLVQPVVQPADRAFLHSRVGELLIAVRQTSGVRRGRTSAAAVAPPSAPATHRRPQPPRRKTKATVRCAPSIPRPAKRSGNSRWPTSPTPAS